MKTFSFDNSIEKREVENIGHKITITVGAGIEYDIAMRMNKDILFETNITKGSIKVLKIKNAIHEVTGLKFNEYTTPSRERRFFFARILFAYHCHQNNMTPSEIANLLNRDRTSIFHFLKKYKDEITYNPKFRALAQRVDNILNKTSNEATTKA